LEDLVFHDGPVPSGYTKAFESSVFNELKHLELQSATGWRSFCLLSKKNRTANAVIHFYIDNNSARSPFKSPFGSVEFSDDVQPIALFHFFEQIESALKADGIKNIIIRTPPAGYHTAQSALVHTFLFNLGYAVIDAEAGAMIDTTSPGIQDDWEKRKLRQGKEAGLKFYKTDREGFTEIYDFISVCRKHKGYSLSMSRTDLEKTMHSFEKSFFLFSVIKDNELAAASVAIKVNSKILYNFYSAHAAKFDTLSPAVFLLDGIYHFCQQEEIRNLDLGTSAVDKKPNFGLLDFKLRLGASPTPKLTFEKNIL
jgi:hypothetical protein